MMRDRSLVQLAEQAAAECHDPLFRTLVQDAPDVFLVLDDDGFIKYATPSATRLYGDVPLKGANVSSLVAGSERVVPHGVFDPATTADVYDGLFRITRHDGRRLVVAVRYTDLRHDQAVRGQVLTVRDVTQEHRLAVELEYQAFHDTLTGLPNRALFTSRAEHALALARRAGRTIAVLFVDLDDFKLVNDTMGHAVGDELLVGVARRLAAVARESDTAARLGGDEFALLVENLPSPEAADSIADRVVAAFGEPFSLPAGPVLAGVTVGVSTTADGSDVREMLEHADLSLYAAKSEGKRRWRRYTPVLSAGTARRRELHEALKDALATSALTLAYRPVVILATRAIAGFEPFVRWPHPVWGTEPTAEVLAVAEESGLIVPLGSWALREAFTDAARWHRMIPEARRPVLGVNASARQLRNPGFAEGLRRCLHDTGLAPSALVLKLSESTLLGPDDRITADLVGLKELGIRLAIDHFGAGYCSPGHLRKLPIDVLRIDKSFVDTVTDPQGRKLTEIMIGIAHAIDAKIIAVGIETEEQRALLMEMGCHLGQGPLLAEPVDAQAAEELLRSRHRIINELFRYR